jgi:hypothetical protein
MTSKHQTILPTILATILIIAVYAANAQLTNIAKIHNTGQISVNKIWAKSGSAEDIQAAVDAVTAAGGGIVYVPAGNFSFNSERASTSVSGIGTVYYGVWIPGGVSVIGAGKDMTVLISSQPSHKTVMFFCDGSNDKPIRISGITFVGYVVGDKDDGTYPYVGYGVRMWNCKKYRVDHCKFLNFPESGVGTGCFQSAAKLENGEYQYYWNWGVVDHCDFDNPYKANSGTWGFGYGVSVIGGGAGTAPIAWLFNLSDILGKWDIETNPIRCALYQWNATKNAYDLVDPYGGKYFRWLVYIEGCTFKRCRHGIASNGGAFYVARHNYFEYNYPIGWPNVDVHGAQGNQGFFGGRGAEVYGNIINETTVTGGWGIDFRGGGGVVFNNTIISCSYGISMRYDGENTNVVCWVKDLWIWNNTFIDVSTQIYDPYDLYEEGVHYFLQPRPNYTPYQYPHPLATE